MIARSLKALFTLAVAAMGLFYALENLVNLDAVYSFVSSVLRMDGHEAYPNSLGPAITAPVLIWLAAAVIIAAELAVAALAGKGAWDLWRARRAQAQEFEAAKGFALAGCGAAFLLWFGLFIVLGGGYFQMWQTEIGRGSLEGAFQFAACAGIALLFINTPDR